MRRGTATYEEFDIATMRDGLAGPGMDTRQWVAIGQVDQDASSGHSVNFNDEDGNALPQGLMVNVTLMTSGISLPCRVSSAVAGSGEGEYSPLGPGDEVVVLIPDGNEREGGIIVGKLSNVHDTMPTTVAGMDVTQNSISFKRIKTPYVLETAGSYLMRQSTTGATWSVDPTGNTMIVDGEGNMLSLSADIISLQESTGTALVQIDPSKLTVSLQADATSMVMASDSTIFAGSGTLHLGAASLAPGQHAVTLEQVINIIANVICGLATVSAFNPPSPFGATFSVVGVASLTTLFATVIPALVTPNPIAASAGAPGGILDALALQPLLTAALAAPPLMGADQAVPLPTPFAPGAGRAAVFI